MKMTPVTSSNIAAMWYDLEKSELYIKFKNSKTFCYLYVTQEEYGRLINAESIGKHFNQFIKAVKVGREVATANEDVSSNATTEDNIRNMLSAIYNAGFEAGEVGACDDIDIIDGYEKEIINLVLISEKDKEKIKVLREALQLSTDRLDAVWSNLGSMGAKAQADNNREALEATKDGE
jgi:hypothetical protein